jgi:hypothetical protein
VAGLHQPSGRHNGNANPCQIPSELTHEFGICPELDVIPARVAACLQMLRPEDNRRLCMTKKNDGMNRQ